MAYRLCYLNPAFKDSTVSTTYVDFPNAQGLVTFDAGIEVSNTGGITYNINDDTQLIKQTAPYTGFINQGATFYNPLITLDDDGKITNITSAGLTAPQTYPLFGGVDVVIPSTSQGNFVTAYDSTFLFPAGIYICNIQITLTTTNTTTGQLSPNIRDGYLWLANEAGTTPSIKYGAGIAPTLYMSTNQSTIFYEVLQIQINKTITLTEPSHLFVSVDTEYTTAGVNLNCYGSYLDKNFFTITKIA
jgi:hypothetical protein